MKNPFNRNFSLLELMFSVALLAILVALVYSLFLTSLDVYEDQSQRMVFEFRVNRILKEINETLRQAWIRSKPAVVDEIPATPEIENLLVPFTISYSVPQNPPNDFDPITGAINWAPSGTNPPRTLQLGPVVRNQVIQDPNTGALQNYELREIQRTGAGATPISVVNDRIYILTIPGYTVANYPAPSNCTLIRNPADGRARAVNFDLLFFDPRTNQTLQAKTTISLINLQPD